MWDGERYLRYNGETPHTWIDVDENEDQVTADVLVVLTAAKYFASPPAGSSGSSVPAMRTTGTGQALLFYDGVLVEGTWERGSIEAPFELSLTDGSAMLVPPGRLWVSIFPTNRSVNWE